MSQRLLNRWPSRFSSGAELGVVVQLAVLHATDLSVLGEERLVATLDIHDREPPRPKRHSWADERAPVIRPAVSA